jgi:LacI family transcriptional regulator
MPTTIRDIAKILNLSVGAVSRALDGYPDISEETRQRVIQAAREMGYYPNRAARQLRRQKADAIGYILPAETPRFADPFFSEFVGGLGDETACYPFDLLISIASPAEESEQTLYQSWVQGRKADGFILTHLHLHDWRVQYLLSQGVPLAALEDSSDGFDFPCVAVDRKSGVVALMDHLIGRGYKRIAYIGGPPDLKIQADHLAGYLEGQRKIDRDYEPDLIIESNLTSNGGYQTTKRLLSIPDPPDAIICINDETAFGVLHAAHEKGLLVGQDLGVAGFDGVQVSGHSEPPLTTLDIPVYDIARQLVKMLQAEMNNQPLPDRRVLLQPKLLVRESTGRNHS